VLAAIISSVVTAVVLGGLGIAWQRTRTLPSAVRRRYESDHQTPHDGPWQVHLPPDCDTADARMTVVCAPSRRLPLSTFAPSSAVRFGQQQLQFHGDPAYSSVDDGVRLEPARDDHGFRGYAWICANGKIQMSVTVPIVTDPATGRRRPDVVRLLGPLTQVLRAVGSAEYRQLYGLPARASGMKTDWLVGVSMYSRPEAVNTVPSWNDLVFPATAASRLVTNRDPFCPPAGYAAGELRDWQIDRPANDLLQAFLASFLAENGYDAFDQVIDATLAGYRV
jgi:hypothetical protein